MAGHLRLVTPAAPSPTGRRKYKRPRPLFSPEEPGRLRAAFNTARGLFGSWRCLGDALHVTYEAVIKVGHGKHPVSPGLVIRLARALGATVDSLYRPPMAVGARCPHCGAKGRP